MKTLDFVDLSRIRIDIDKPTLDIVKSFCSARIRIILEVNVGCGVDDIMYPRIKGRLMGNFWNVQTNSQK
jgi:hypothetical protein